MDILSRLSSSPSSVEAVAKDCLDQPAYLDRIAEGLRLGSAPVVANCTEVMTKVAESRPDLVAPYAETLVALLSHKNGRVRWEAAHSLALAAHLIESTLERNLPLLVERIRTHEGVIVRDYTLDAVGRYGALGPAQARVAWGILAEALTLWEGRHTARILGHLGPIAEADPALRTAIAAVAQRHESAPKAGTRKAAKALLKTVC